MKQSTNNTSLLLLTHNSSKNLSTNFSWLDKCPTINEVVIVDDNSSDDTKKSAKALENKNRKVMFFERSLAGDFASQRNFGVSKVSNDWVLWLDSDETPSPELIDFLNSFDFPTKKNYAFKRCDIFLGRNLKHGENQANNFLRLFYKKNGKFKLKVHEIWDSNNVIITTNIAIIHKPNVDLYGFLKKINEYSEIKAKELLDRHIDTNIVEIILYPLGKFLQNYILRMGFLDSTQGIIMALAMSLHSFLVRAKLWQMSQK